MTSDDAIYVERLIRQKQIQSPCLEMGVGYEGWITKNALKKAGIDYVGTDMIAGQNVDIVADFEKSEAEVRSLFRDQAPFGSVLLMNVLEHSFDPLRILDNAMALLRPAGTCIVLTPTVWPLHTFPYDTWRINPNLYEQYSVRRGHRLVQNSLEFIGYGSVSQFKNADGSYSYPPPKGGTKLFNRAIHKIFATHGRAMFFPSHIATAAIIKKSA